MRGLSVPCRHLPHFSGDFVEDTPFVKGTAHGFAAKLCAVSDKGAHILIVTSSFLDDHFPSISYFLELVIKKKRPFIQTERTEESVQIIPE